MRTTALAPFALLLASTALQAGKFPVGIDPGRIDPGKIVLDPGFELKPVPSFRRGDVRVDGTVELSDAITLLRHLFFGDPATIPCADAADANDDGALGLGDAVTILSLLFSGGRALPEPSTTCGVDPTSDSLGCASFDLCKPPAPAPAPSPAQLRKELAYHYAPVHYQDASSSAYRYDMLARIDFDGNWDMANKWEAAASMGRPEAHVYYSVVATQSHWYLIYGFYHPRDWASGTFDDEHENDMEGLLAVVYRDGSKFGKLEAIVTAAHYDFYSYTPVGSDFSAGAETIDGVLSLVDGSHPATYQEPEGHGCYALGGSHREDSDGIWYYPSLPYLGHEEATRPDFPTSAGGDANPTAYYTLIDIFEAGGLWDRRGDAITFANYNQFRGDEGGGCGDGITVKCSENSANAPWGWDDNDDGPVFAGEQAFDPAHLVAYYFNTSTWLARDYEYNPYAVQLDLETLTVLSDQDGSNDLSDVYFNLYIADGRGALSHDGYEDGIVDGDSGAQLSWIQWDVPVGTTIDLGRAMPRNRFYTMKGVDARGSAPTFEVRVMDWDSGSGDEWLMSPASYHVEYASDGVIEYDFGRSRLRVRLTEAPGV